MNWKFLTCFSADTTLPKTWISNAISCTALFSSFASDWTAALEPSVQFRIE